MNYDALFSTIETIGTTNPIADENGALTIAPTHKRTPGILLDDKMIAESKNKKTEYDLFFGAVDKANGDEIGSNKNTTQKDNSFMKNKAKNILTEAVSLMEDKSIEYWTDDKSILEACRKLRPILDKITKRM